VNAILHVQPSLCSSVTLCTRACKDKGLTANFTTLAALGIVEATMVTRISPWSPEGEDSR
jgi:hypothetical protein